MTDYSTKEYVEEIDIKDSHKLNLLKNLIPQDVDSIIDIGCGNGFFTNEFSKEYYTLGVDVNASKLKYVKNESLLSSSDKINKPDRSFDLVFSSELLEHLDINTFNKTLSEFSRLANKYILISVPYNEPLQKLFVQCNYCETIYNKNGHLRKFTQENIKYLFDGFVLSSCSLYGQKIRGYSNFLGALKRALTPSGSSLPKLWRKKQGVTNSYCTVCGNKNEIKYRFNLLAFILDSFNVVISSKQPGQIIALYQRK